MAWQKVASLDALRDGGVLGVEVEGATVALYRVGDAVHATDGICTHALAQLADGYFDGSTIECPIHQAVFDIRTGEVLGGPATEELRVYKVRVDGNDVLIDLAGDAAAAETVPAASVAAAAPVSPAAAHNGGGRCSHALLQRHVAARRHPHQLSRYRPRRGAGERL